jgi:DNA-directed RNA polymerase subunit RPC12/RpoP
MTEQPKPETAAFASKDQDMECPECNHRWPVHPNTVGSVSWWCPNCGEKFRAQGRK